MRLKNWLTADRSRAAKLAEFVGVSTAIIYLWSNESRPIPIDRATAVEKGTEGAVTRLDCRPDDWVDHWPELIPLYHVQATECQARRLARDSDKVAA